MKGMRLIGMMLDLTVNAWVVCHAHFLWNPTFILFSFEEEGFSRNRSITKKESFVKCKGFWRGWKLVLILQVGE